MSVLIVIPARYASSRYPGKPLAALTGAGGDRVTLIERSWRAATAVSGNHRVVVATDDARIADEAARFGGEVVMTPETCENGTAPLCSGAGRDRRDARHHRQPARRCAVDAAVVRRGADRGHADRRRGGLHAGIALRSRDTRTFPRGSSCGQGRRDDRRFRCVRRTRSTSPRKCFPTFRTLIRSRHRFRSFTMSGCTPIGQTRLRATARYRPGRSNGLRGLSSCASSRTASRSAVSEVNARGRVFWELNNPEDIPRIETAFMAHGIE